MADKYTAVWVSHTSISDFLKCPRSYYLKHMYKNPTSGHKMKVISPALALGQAVHEVIESLSVLPTHSRFDEGLMDKFEASWKKVTGKKGGFADSDVELLYKNRGIAMLQRVMKNPGPLKNLAVKIKMDLPHFWLSEDDNIILCGKIDWLEYFPETDSVHVIDFKTSKHNEGEDSLQLPIYHMLVKNCQGRPVTKASYWYLERSDICVECTLPDLDECFEKVLKIAKQMKVARQLGRFKCEHDGCFACEPMEKVLKGDAEFVGSDEYNYDIYTLKDSPAEIQFASEIL